MDGAVAIPFARNNNTLVDWKEVIEFGHETFENREDFAGKVASCLCGPFARRMETMIHGWGQIMNHVPGQNI